MEIKEIKKLEKNLTKFYCQFCDFKCTQKCDWERHIARPKHIGNQNRNILEIKKLEKNLMVCDCGQNFKTSSGLWKHKKKCLYKEEQNKEAKDKEAKDKEEKEEKEEKEDEIMFEGINIKDRDALVLHLLKQNSDLHNKLIDLFSQSTSNNSHNTTNNNISNNINNNNNNNKTFNLQFFLNETCKDAMNISEFVSSIKMDLDDLEHTGRTNYVEGISNIVIKNLNNLEQQLRPLHCTDFKREVLYIKENDEWTKESDSKPILTRTIKTIANQNIKQINKWVQNHPDCVASHSKKNDLYLKIVSNSMNGLTKEESDKNMNKIISNVAKKVLINK